MIPYIVINGKPSNLINGLLIQTLPPISKPKMRTSIEEIDGRDGDIVTTLGYAAYDKQFAIGLHGQFDINDIISFFNTSGTIIFSNEPDKLYNFALYEQIDFAKLVRFKTANVKLHVQPFKYDANEKEKVYTYAAGTTSATITARNNGNIYSKPTLSITGTGTIYVYINGVQQFTIELPSTSTEIILNAATMNAYDNAGNFLNRLVTGDYSKLILQPNLNELTVSGNITQLSIVNVSRWI